MHTYHIPQGLEKSASTDAARYVMNSVHFNADRNEWAATNGGVLSVAPEPAGDRPSVTIPLECVKWSRKTKCPVEFDGKKTLRCAGKEFLPVVSEFPRYWQVWPDAEKYAESCVSFDAELLVDLLASMPRPKDEKGREKKHERRVILRLNAKDSRLSPILIESRENSGIRGILMPLRF